jgi:predicted nucleotidyltransferase
MTVASATQLDARSEAYLAEVLRAIDSSVTVVEAYLLGSGAGGPFDPQTSDIDVVVVVARPFEDSERERFLGQLSELDCPARDLELVVYVQGSQPPDFELNVNEGEERLDEEAFWFVLDAAVAEERAVPVWDERPWARLFQSIAPERIRSAIAESLAWSERQPRDDEFARLNAVRARHYLARGEWISKAEAREKAGR